MDPYNSLDARKRSTDLIEWSEVAPTTQRQEIAAMPAIKPVYPMCFPETDAPEVVREDVRDAVIDAVALAKYNPEMYGADAYYEQNGLGMSDSVNLPPLELEF
jgi:hypothetical protein